MNPIFSAERVNTGRQLEFDLVKAVTIIFMIWTHTYESLSTGFEPSLSAINSYVRGSIAGAVTFMFCMGIGLSYTRHNSAKECLQRGFKLLTTGFTLFLCREIIPASLSSLIFNLPDNLVYLAYGVSVDILQFAGLAFLFVGCLKKLKIGNGRILLISVALSILGTLLEGVSTGCYPVDQLLGFLWGISWVIIMFISYFSFSLENLCTDIQVIIAWICILAATILSVVIYSKYLKERTESFFGKHRVLWTVFVWAACIASFILAMCLFDKYPNFMNV